MSSAKHASPLATKSALPPFLLLIDTVKRYSPKTGRRTGSTKRNSSRIRTLENLKTLLAGAREQGFPVFHAPMSYTESDYTTWKHISGVHHEMFDNRLFAEGSWGADFHPDLAPADGEIVIAPHKNIGVPANTDLEVQMRQHDVEYIAVTGMVGTMCVESTARNCMEHGFHVTTFTDATAAFGGRLHATP
ncbi:cysteine hydrolase family protein [Streptomyces sp. NPDC056704]|uniref:cysteine hydrolase family protein n=1 Tax=Streptomyces sp. NPDC056704 TaxID=3345917 RepID=UPI0036C6EF72